VSRAGLEPATL